MVARDESGWDIAGKIRWPCGGFVQWQHPERDIQIGAHSGTLVLHTRADTGIQLRDLWLHIVLNWSVEPPKDTFRGATITVTKECNGAPHEISVSNGTVTTWQGNAPPGNPTTGTCLQATENICGGYVSEPHGCGA